MTQEEEVLLSLEDINPREIASHIEHGTLHQWIKSWKAETRESIIAALRPVSREQVEKVFPGCRSCKSCRSCVFGIHAIKDMPCKKCDPNAEGVLTEYKPSNFCPVCGKPLTDEAVQMVMERLEALKDGKGV